MTDPLLFSASSRENASTFRLRDLDEPETSLALPTVEYAGPPVLDVAAKPVDVFGIVETLQEQFPEIETQELYILFRKYTLLTGQPGMHSSEMPSFTAEDYKLVRHFLKELKSRELEKLEAYDLLEKVESSIQRAYELRKERLVHNEKSIESLGDLLQMIPRKSMQRMDVATFNKTAPEKARLQLLQFTTRVYFDWHEPFATRIDFLEFLKLYELDDKKDLNPKILKLLQEIQGDLIKISQASRLFLYIFDALSKESQLLFVGDRIRHILERSKQEYPQTGPSITTLGASVSGMMRAMIATRKNCPVELYDIRQPSRENIIKLNKNDYLVYFPILPLMRIEGKAKNKGAFIFSKIVCVENAMEYVLGKMGVRPDRSKRWMSTQPQGDQSICTFYDMDAQRLIRVASDVVADCMGASSGLPSLLGNQREHLSRKDIMVVARYDHKLPHLDEHPHLAEHMIFEDEVNSTTLSRLREKPLDPVVFLFREIQSIRRAIKKRKLLQAELHTPLKEISQDIQRLSRNLRGKKEHLTRVIIPLLPQKTPPSALVDCFEVTCSRLTKSAMSAGGLVLWGGDSYATGHPRDGLGTNTALRAGAFALALESLRNADSRASICSQYEFGSLSQVEALHRDY